MENNKKTSEGTSRLFKGINKVIEKKPVKGIWFFLSEPDGDMVDAGAFVKGNGSEVVATMVLCMKKYPEIREIVFRASRITLHELKEKKNGKA